MLTMDEDRRVHTRIALERPCKIYDHRSGRYVLGITRDLSEGGMMVAIDRDLALCIGNELHVGIAQKRRQMFLRSTDMLRMRVARYLGTPTGEWIIGLEMIQPVSINTAALRLAA